MRPRLLLIPLLWQVISGLHDGAHAFEPGPSRPRPADLFLSPMPQDEYAESLTFVAYLQDGNRAEIGFQLSNIGPGSDNAGFNAEVILGVSRLQVRESVKHRYRWTSAPLTIEMGEVGKSQGWVRLRTVAGEAGQAGHVVEITAAGKDFSLRLRFRALTAAWRPGSGQIHFDDRVFQYMIQVPRAEVTGQITAAGKEQAVFGRGYVEHGRTNADARRHTDRQLRLRYYDEIDGQPLTVLAYDQVSTPKDGSRRFGFVVVLLGDRVLYENATPLLQPLSLHPDPLRKQNLIPAGYKLNAGTQVQISAQVGRLVERSDYLDEVSGFLRLILRHFIHPVSYNYDCTADVALQLPGLTTRRHGWADCGISLTRP